jgi:hypothetical protein
MTQIGHWGLAAVATPNNTKPFPLHSMGHFRPHRGSRQATGAAIPRNQVGRGEHKRLEISDPLPVIRWGKQAHQFIYPIVRPDRSSGAPLRLMSFGA